MGSERQVNSAQFFSTLGEPVGATNARLHRLLGRRQMQSQFSVNLHQRAPSDLRTAQAGGVDYPVSSKGWECQAGAGGTLA